MHTPLAVRLRHTRLIGAITGAIALGPAMAAAVALPLALPPALAAQQRGADTTTAQRTSPDTAALQRVVITANRVAVPQATATLSTTVITGAQLRAEGITTVQDALATVPGVYAPRSGSYGSQTSLFLRGGESDYTQVLVDGVSVNDPGGALNLANLTTDDIDRIEVVRGPASVVYGANAVTGVIQIFTRDGRGADAHPELTLGARGGTYGTDDAEGTLTAGGARASGSLSVGRHRTDGIYAFGSQSRNDTFSGLLRLAPDLRSAVHVALRYIDAGSHFPTNGFGEPVDTNQFSLEQRWIGSVDAHRYLTGRLDAHLLVGATNDATRAANLATSPGETCDLCFDSHTGTYRRNIDAHLDLHASPDVVITGGGSYERQSQHTTGSDPVARHLTAYYAQAVGSVRDAFSYTLGARVDDNSAFGTFGTYRAAAGYRWRTGTSVRASYGTAFREPTFDQTSANSPFEVGNPDLRPERTRSWEAGVAQRIAGGALTLAATYFNQRFRDLIQFNPAPPTNGATSFLNIAAANADGLELETHYAPASRWTVAASYTWLHTRVTDAGFDSGPTAVFAAGEPLIRRPASSANLNVGFLPVAHATLHLNVGVVGRRDDIDFQNGVRVEAPAYTKVDLSADYQLAAVRATTVTLTARGENLFGERYQQVFGFAAPGRVLLVGAQLGFGLGR